MNYENYRIVSGLIYAISSAIMIIGLTIVLIVFIIKLPKIINKTMENTTKTISNEINKMQSDKSKNTEETIKNIQIEIEKESKKTFDNFDKTDRIFLKISNFFRSFRYPFLYIFKHKSYNLEIAKAKKKEEKIKKSINTEKCKNCGEIKRKNKKCAYCNSK